MCHPNYISQQLYSTHEKAFFETHAENIWVSLVIPNVMGYGKCGFYRLKQKLPGSREDMCLWIKIQKN